MRKILFLLTIIFFLFDYSFFPLLFPNNGSFSFILFPWLSLLVFIFFPVQERKVLLGVFLIIGSCFLELFLAGSCWEYLIFWLIAIIILSVIQKVFVNERLNFWQKNLIFFLYFIIFFVTNNYFFSSQPIEIKFKSVAIIFLFDLLMFNIFDFFWIKYYQD